MVTNPAGPVLDYLAQVREKDETEGWRNCTQQRNQSLQMCVIKNLKSSTAYIVRVAGRNVVGYGEFAEQEVQTTSLEATDKDDEDNDDNEVDQKDEDNRDETTEDGPKGKPVFHSIRQNDVISRMCRETVTSIRHSLYLLSAITFARARF